MMKDIKYQDMNKALMFALPALLVCACSQKGERTAALDLGDLDTTVAPGTDFYRYSTGGWSDRNPLGAEYARFGSFDRLSEDNITRLNDLFKGMAEMKTAPGSIERKIADLYGLGLDSTRLNAEGAEPIKAYLAEISAVSDKASLVVLRAKMYKDGINPFFGGYVAADLTDSDSQIFYLGQGGLGMGDRDYYVDPKNAALKEGYKAYLAKILTLAGVENAEVAAANALAVEDEIARNSWTREQERDIQAQYNPMSSQDLFKAYPGFDFKSFFEGAGIAEQKTLIVCEPSYFEAFANYFEKADLQVLKDYFTTQLIDEASSHLSDDFQEASFDFYRRQMSGVQQQKPRWKRAMAVPNGVLGEAVGKMYVARYFPESSKKKMLALVGNLQKALSQHIDSLDWMGDSTKVKAHEKLDAFVVKIGYPDKWKDYSSLEINPEKSWFENILNASRWYVQDNLSKLGKPTDRTEWGMTPQTVNAYYNPTTNEICFPAAILQPPFFNPDADDAVNYGGIGVVIGHEMSHGFDDQGRLFDAKGNMVSWWTDDDDKKFRQKAEILASQYDKVEILPGLMANGHFTLGENIGDHGGLSIAYTAMENAIAGKNVGLIEGFTPAQRFYLSYGKIWAQNITDEEKARLTSLDPHSLAENRVNVAVRNFQSFYDAFGIKEGEPMYLPESERVIIW